MWTGVSIIMLLAGICAMVWWYASQKAHEPEGPIPATDPLGAWASTPSQRATLKYFWVVSALIVGAWVYRAILQFVFNVHQGWFYEAFDTRFDHLLVGCLLALLLFKAPKERWARWERYCSNGALLLGACVLLAFSAYLEFLYNPGYRDSIAFIVDPLLVVALIPMLIAQRERIAVRWLESAPVKYVGRISYSAYLYQQWVADPVMRLLRGLPLFLRVALTVGAVIVAASCSYYLIERPFLKLKDWKYRNKAQTSAAAGDTSAVPQSSFVQ